jgi:hypothetical protein
MTRCLLGTLRDKCKKSCFFAHASTFISLLARSRSSRSSTTFHALLLLLTLLLLLLLLLLPLTVLLLLLLLLLLRLPLLPISNLIAQTHAGHQAVTCKWFIGIWRRQRIALSRNESSTAPAQRARRNESTHLLATPLKPALYGLAIIPACHFTQIASELIEQQSCTTTINKRGRCGMRKLTCVPERRKPDLTAVNRMSEREGNMREGQRVRLTYHSSLQDLLDMLSCT